MSFYYGKKWVDSMNSKRCMRNAVCNTCFDKSKCDGKISKYKNKKVVYKDMKFDSKKDEQTIVEDVKPSANFQTDVYKIKKKLMAYMHKIEIKEVL